MLINKRNKVLACLLAALILISSLSFFSVFADNNSDFSYEIKTDEFANPPKDYVEITAYNGSDPHMVIPSEIEGLPVTSIHDYAFGMNEAITSVTFPETLESIGGMAFSGCTGLTKVEIPENVKILHYESFAACKNLTEVTLNNPKVAIARNVFYCPLLIVNFNGTMAQCMPDHFVIPAPLKYNKDVKIICTDGTLVMGDVNKDGNIDVYDVTTIQKYLVGLVEINSPDLCLADYNMDMYKNIKDATALQKAISGIN